MSGDSSLHLLTGPAGAQALRQLLPAQEVLEVVEDFAHGPLADADTIDPQLRLAWWNRLWWALNWWPDLDEAFQHDYWQCRKRLFRAFSQRQPLCLWLGDGAHDRLLLDMLCAHAHAAQPLAVVEISGRVPCSHHGYVALGMCDADALRPLLGTARRLSAEQRQAHAAEWAHWQQQGQGWRELHDAALVEYPASCFDAALLEALRRHGPQPAARLAGWVMGQHTTAFVPDNYLLWRLSTLADAGLVVLMPQPEGPPEVALR